MDGISQVVTARDTCRTCYSPDLVDLFSLGEHYVSDFVSLENVHKGIKGPIDLVLCNGCKLVQLRHTAPQELLYARHYWYRSGVTDTMRVALANIVEDAVNLVGLDRCEWVLDIGSNDGTLLRQYPHYVNTIGFEPATNLAEEGRKALTHFVNDFWSYEKYREVAGDRKCRVITAIGMFYDLEDPNQFIGDIAKALAPDGVFIAQLMTLRNMLNINDVGNLCHEHLEFYSFASLVALFNKHGLEIFDIKTNSVNGQSDRIYVRLREGSTIKGPTNAWERLNTVIRAERGLDEVDYYKRFFERMEHNKEKVRHIVQQLARFSQVWVYGASTKGNTILQYYGLDKDLISGASDRSPEKWGKYTIGTGIKISDEENARVWADHFLVLPYAFINEFLEREKAWHVRGRKFIVPLPEMRII